MKLTKHPTLFALAALAVLAAPSAALATTLLGQWGFEGNLEDSQGPYDGTASGTVAYSADVPSGGGQSLSLTGSGYVDVTYSALQFSRPITVSVWVKPSAIPSGTIFYSGTGSNPQLFFFVEPSGATNRVGLYTSDKFEYGGAITPGTWNHIEIVRDATGLGSIFVNGVSTGTVTAGPSGNPGSIRIGGGGAFTPGNFSGLIDDFRIYGEDASVPEPGLVALLVLGGATASSRRRRAPPRR